MMSSLFSFDLVFWHPFITENSDSDSDGKKGDANVNVNLPIVIRGINF